MTDRTEVASIGEISIARGGHIVGVDLHLANGQSVKLDFEHELLPKLFHLMQYAGNAATQTRIASANGSLDAISRPYFVAGWRIGVDADYLANEFRVAEGVPLTVAIQREQIQALTNEIYAALDDPPPRRQ